MKNSIVLFLYVLIPLFCNSQTAQIESDSLAQYSFKDLANKYESIRNTNSEKSKIYLNALFSKASKRKEKITVFLKKCHHEILYGTEEKASSYLEAAYDLAKNEKNIELAYVYEKKGYFYYNQQDYDNALDYYLKALVIAEEKQNSALLIKIEHKIGAIYYSLKETDKALKMYNSAYKKAEADSISDNLKITLLKSLGNAYLRKYSANKEQKKLLDSSSFFIQKGLQFTTHKKDQNAIAYFKYSLGIKSFIGENYLMALSHFDSSLEIYKVIKRSRMLRENYFYKGKTFLKLKQPDSAIFYIKKSEPFFKDSSKKITHTSTYSLLSESYEQKGDLKNAIKYAQLAITYNEQLSSNNSHTKSSINENYTLPKLKKRILKLEQDLQNVSQKKTSLYALSLLLIAVLILGYFFFRRRELKNKASFEKLLHEAKENNTNSVKKVIPEIQTQQILDALDKFEKDLLFLKQNCSLPSLAKKLHTNTAYLSNIINEYKNQSYTTYIKSLRIQYAIKRLKDDSRFRAYTIESIAKECGFKTAKSFSRSFKTATNIYPSTFIRSLNKLDNQSN